MDGRDTTAWAGNKVAAVIVAAGRGERAGLAEGPKQYRRIGGKAVLRRTLEVFLRHAEIGPVVVVIHPDDAALLAETIGDLAEQVLCVSGGPTRQDSTRLGLTALRKLGPEKVLIHDGVRAFVDFATIDRVVAAIGATHGALPVLPVADTLKQASDGLVRATVARDGVYGAQTPQGFPFAAILDAHERAAVAGRTDYTDDAAIAEWAGLPVRIVEGSPENVKLTFARDIAMADQRLSGTFPDVRTGNGYDVHAFEPGDGVMLCGVRIAHHHKLAGHSDADVALHALTDALLATCAAGDIGTHFPPSDPQWRGAESRRFVEHAVRAVRSKQGRIAHADVTLICEAPRIGPHRPAMTSALAAMLGISADRVSVKATTNERLGFVGREEGIAALATATVIFPGEVPS